MPHSLRPSRRFIFPVGNIKHKGNLFPNNFNINGLHANVGSWNIIFRELIDLFQDLDESVSYLLIDRTQLLSVGSTTNMKKG